MKSLIIYLAKKYIISAINDILEKYKDDVYTLNQKIEIWIKRLQIIVEQLKLIMARISDGKIESEEVDASVEEVEKIIKGWE